jgi:hypothetical protein
MAPQGPLQQNDRGRKLGRLQVLLPNFYVDVNSEFFCDVGRIDSLSREGTVIHTAFMALQGSSHQTKKRSAFAPILVMQNFCVDVNGGKFELMWLAAFNPLFK